MKHVTLTSKNQITIPAAVVRQLGLNHQRRLSIDVQGDKIIMQPEQTLDQILAPLHAELKQYIKSPLTDKDIRDARQQAHEERNKRLVQRLRESDASSGR